MSCAAFKIFGTSWMRRARCRRHLAALIRNHEHPDAMSLTSRRAQMCLRCPANILGGRAGDSSDVARPVSTRCSARLHLRAQHLVDQARVSAEFFAALTERCATPPRRGPSQGESS